MEPSKSRLNFMEQTLEQFRDHYAANPELKASLARDLDGIAIDDRNNLAAWTMMAHSLLNLESVKNRR